MIILQSIKTFFFLTCGMLMYQDSKELKVDNSIVLLNLLMLSFIFMTHSAWVGLTLVGLSIILIAKDIDKIYNMNTIDIVYFILTLITFLYVKGSLDIEFIILPIIHLILYTVVSLYLYSKDKIPYLPILLPALSMLILVVS